MSLPDRQQQILDQIEQVLQAADPRLKSMFATFARYTSREAMPASEAIVRRSARGILVVSVILISMLGTLMFDVISTKHECPGLPSDQAVATAAVRYASCNHSTDAWSKGAR